MTWYTASVVLAIYSNGIEQDEVPVFENFYLIEARNHAEAVEMAEVIGRDEAAANQDVEYKSLPARFYFVGIRKVRSVYNPAPLDLDTDRPICGTELSHSYFELKNRSEVEKFAKGQSVCVEYIDDDDDKSE